MMERITIFLGALWKVLVKNFVIVISILGFIIYRSLYTPQNFVVFFDVGQGDSSLISIGEYQILVDGGPGDYILNELPKYMPPWDMKIEIVVLSHPHADHIDGLYEAMSRYETEEVLYNNVCYGMSEYGGFLSENIIELSSFNGIGSQGGNMLNMLIPPIDYSSGDCTESWNGNINNDSLVFEFIYGENNILFMGDAEEELEEYFISSNQLSDVDILKAGHHCSDTSSSLEFLKRVNPELVICSYGEDNRYGHPSDITIQKFQDLGINYISTEKEGNIVILLE